MITIDSREPGHVKDYLTAALGPENVKQGQLPTADIVFADYCGHTVGVERKTVADLLGSVASGRLASQLTRLRDEFAVPILIVEGGYGLDGDRRIRVAGRQTGWSNGSVQAALFSLQGAGIYVLTVP